MSTNKHQQNASGPARRVIVVGGGLAGLMTTIKLCEARIAVDLFSLVPAKRSHSVCAQGGINAAVNTMGEGDSPSIHLQETAYGGDFLANQPPIKGMTDAAPGIVFLLDRMGVPFHRTPEGLLDFRRFGGSLYHRTAYAGATTGQQLLYALDEQVRRFATEAVMDPTGMTLPGERLVRRFEGWDFLSLVLDDHGRCVGIVAQHLQDMVVRVFRAQAVCLATGGLGMVFGRSTNSMICTGSAAAIAFRQGAVYANGEFVQVHPTAIPGADKLRLISESVRGEGGRVWVPKDAKDARPPSQIPHRERDYFLERRYPGYGNLVPRDIASRAIFQVCFHEGRGIRNENTGKNEHEVYLDLTHIPPARLREKLGGVLEIYTKFVGADPCSQPMKVFPAVHYSMGGLWVVYERNASGSLTVGSPRNHATSIPGLYAVGEVDYAYHGANRLGANSLLSCLYGGLITGPAVASYVDALPSSAYDLPADFFEKAEENERKNVERTLARYGDNAEGINPWKLHAQLSDVMLRDCTIERHDDRLDNALDTIETVREQLPKMRIEDTGERANQSAQFARHFENMVLLAHVIAKGARERSESRGAHYKPAFEKRDDAKWLRTTLAKYSSQEQVQFIRSFDYDCVGQSIHVTDEVDVSLVPPRQRNYEKAGAASEQATGDAPAEAL